MFIDLLIDSNHWLLLITLFLLGSETLFIVWKMCKRFFLFIIWRYSILHGIFYFISQWLSLRNFPVCIAWCFIKWESTVVCNIWIDIDLRSACTMHLSISFSYHQTKRKSYIHACNFENKFQKYLRIKEFVSNI